MERTTAVITPVGAHYLMPVTFRVPLLPIFGAERCLSAANAAAQLRTMKASQIMEEIEVRPARNE
jgi:hypothetical protein